MGGDFLNLRTCPEPLNRQRIADLAKTKRGTALCSLHHVIDMDWMREAFRPTLKDGAPGCSTGVTWRRNAAVTPRPTCWTLTTHQVRPLSDATGWSAVNYSKADGSMVLAG